MATKVRTKDNTSFDRWLAFANQAFVRRGMPLPTRDSARDAYEMGESPETWADFVLNS